MILFKEKKHEYFSEDGQEYTSVSNLISKYKQPYDTDYWSRYKALEELIPNFTYIKGKFSSPKEAVRILTRDMDSPKFWNTVQKYVDMWSDNNKKAIGKGNLYHKDAEKMSYLRGIIENPFTKTGAKVIKLEKVKGYENNSTPDLYQLADGFYPELLLWNAEYRLAGQADKVYITTVGETRYVDVDDYKTNKKIKTEGFRGQTMKYPLNHLQDCHLSYYSLAISTYAWMLEEAGYTVRHLGFHHYNTLWKVQYMKKEVEMMLSKIKLPESI